jgi:hypothetical protein
MESGSDRLLAVYDPCSPTVPTLWQGLVLAVQMGLYDSLSTGRETVG